MDEWTTSIDPPPNLCKAYTAYNTRRMPSPPHRKPASKPTPKPGKPKPKPKPKPGKSNTQKSNTQKSNTQKPKPGGKSNTQKPPVDAPHVVERRAIRVTHALPMDAPSALQLHGSKRLRVAVYSEFFPVAYREAGGGYRGFDVDLIEAFSKAAGLAAPKYVRVADFFEAWEQPGRWADRVDVAIGGIGRERYRVSPGVEWSLPYFEVRRTVVYNLGDPIRRFPEDVTGVVAGTMGSTGMADAADRMRQKFGARVWDHLQARWKTSDEQDLRDLLGGEIQGLMRGSFVGKALVARHPARLGMAAPWDAAPGAVRPYGREVFAFPCRRGSGLAGMLNAFLMRAAQKGTLAALAERHGMA